jgi:hypothetical protein
MRYVNSLRVCLLTAVFSLASCKSQSGVASLRFVNPLRTDPPVDASKLRIEVSTTVFSEAEPIEPLALPQYPHAALAAHTGAITIVVKIRVGKDGLVKEVSRSLADTSFPTRFDSDFHRSIEAALAQWRFEPAEISRLEPVKDGPPIVADSTEAETSFDVEFRFSQSGAVTSKSLQP